MRYLKYLSTVNCNYNYWLKNNSQGLFSLGLYKNDKSNKNSKLNKSNKINFLEITNEKCVQHGDVLIYYETKKSNIIIKSPFDCIIHEKNQNLSIINKDPENEIKSYIVKLEQFHTKYDYSIDTISKYYNKLYSNYNPNNNLNLIYNNNYSFY